jgi:hypothetical protein
MSNSLARHRTHSSKTLNADSDRRHARSSRELAPDPLMAAALDCFSLTLKVHSNKAHTLAPGLSRRAQKDVAQVKRSKTVFEQDRVDGARS